MAKDNFEACCAITLKFEGGYSNNPKDKGGATNYGITIATLSQWLGRGATIGDVKDITVSLAMKIYRVRYWNAIHGDSLPKGVDMIAFDIAVNSGVGVALSWLAQCANLPVVKRIDWLDARRRSFWHTLRSFVTFGRGWINRENAVYIAAKHMI